ncbi:MAG TPA: extracellular solute-binding protein [Candidatus Krumholzibacteria bacterium]|nr:extracellular solute-binding protein [Candidatus Krumholzibacteria bacterium]
MTPRPRHARALSLALLTAAAVLAGAVGCGRVDRADQITIWEQMDPRERALLEKHIAQFQAAHPEYAHLRIARSNYNTEDLRTQFQTAALAYGGPNLVYGPSDQIGPFTIMGLIEPLDELLPAEVFARFDPSGLPTLEGHVWGLPDQVGNHLTLVANTDHVDAIPQDSDAWVEQLKRLTVDADGDGRPEVYGVVFDRVEPFFLVPWLGGFGGWVMDQDAAPTLDTPGVIQALAFLKALLDAGVMPRECDYQLADTLFKEGRAAYIVNGPWSWDGYRTAGVPIALAPLPRISATGLWPSPMTAAKCYSVNKALDPATRQATLDLLLWLTSADVQADLARELAVLPADLAVRERPELVADPLLAASREQVDKGRLMPIVPEMRAIWDAMRPAYQSCLAGRLTPEEAAREMQERAVRLMKEMRE